MGRIQEKIQKNKVNAPVIFIGCGGIGSKIVKGVADRAVHDDNANLRFVIMDTDVNDISGVDKEANIVAVQTSSTATIENYLKNDKEAKSKWFPVNKMLDSKPVSEGAGQVRAISRLALNSTVKQGKIMTLYNAIDDLFLKDGGKFRQAVKVVIASTAAGGTGSGIAMEIGMLVRNYINKNYPEAAVLIRGFLVMPGVMDTVIDTRSERESIRCNGYATIKEINAFMMKGSGFFDTVPELNRYRDLCLSIPGTSSEEETISCLPFDFCFLLDRADSNSGIMPSISQYINYASQAIYEQNIGAMSTKSSSKEDNVLKLCIRPETLGRCRFGGAGASKLIYPYEKVRDYLALNWARTSIIGSSANKHLSEAEKLQIVKGSWLQYDIQYREELRKYEDNPAGDERPQIEEVYVRALMQGKDTGAGNPFSARMWNKYIHKKILETKSAEAGKPTDSSPDLPNILTERIPANSATEKVARAYIATIIQEILDNRLPLFDSEFTDDFDTMGMACSKDGLTHLSRYISIESVEDLAKSSGVEKASQDLANAVFSSTASSLNDRLGDYMLEKYISANGKVMHPNAVRFMLYELKKFVDEAIGNFKSGANEVAFDSMVGDICFGAVSDDGKRDTADFNVPGFKARGKETSLKAMCEACDKTASFGEGNGGSCEEKLDSYARVVRNYLIHKIGLFVCRIASPALGDLLKAFEQFYGTFESKVPMLEKKKEDIVTELSFKEGDYILYLFRDKKVLDRLSDLNATPTESSDSSYELYAKIYDNIRDNSYAIARNKYNPYGFSLTKDIFFEVIVPYFVRMVEDGVEDINTDNILSAIKLEAVIKNNIAVENTTPSQREEKYRVLNTEEAYHKYISDMIVRCQNLASPGILKNTHDEAREVSSVAYSSAMKDGGGIRVSDFLKDQVSSDTVSLYELHFFRSTYNITPTQLAKLSAPSEEEISDQFALSSQGELELPSAGDYFRIYQTYMNTIGPDSKTSAVITPHIDKRWNAISVLPELDMNYQRKLMSKIHKSFLYGFVYDRIKMRPTSDEEDRQLVYVYYDNDEIRHDMKVSNNTRCDELYEVLDCLYFDRQAVETIRDYVNGVRIKLSERGCKSIADSDFFKALAMLNMGKVIGTASFDEEVISLFEIVLLYGNSVPSQMRDESEIRIMVKSVIEIIQSEINSVTGNPDTALFKTAESLIAQYQMFAEHYHNHKDVLRKGIFSDDVLETVRNSLIYFFRNNDMMKYTDKVKEIARLYG